MSHLVRVFNFKRKPQSGYAYTHVESRDQDSESIDDATEQNLHKKGQTVALRRFERLLWLAVTVLLSAALSWRALADHDHNQHRRQDLSMPISSSWYETGFETDLGIATQHISLKPVQYTSGIERHQDGTLFLNLTGARKVYVGEPSLEIEANWEELEGAVELVVSRGETATKGGRLVHTMSSPGENGQDQYRISIDVIHSLHCVNQLRKAVYSDHYFPGKPTAWYFTHMNHCVDHLRQAIECHSDLTPLAYEFNEEKKQGSPIWTNPHMCRDFEKMLAWDLTRVGPVII